MKNKIIKFATKTKHIEYPKPARNFIPEWYKKAERFIGGKPHINHPDGIGGQTIKVCSPFLDTLTAGYIVELWQDLEIRYENGVPTLHWSDSPKVAGARDPSIFQGMPVTEEYISMSFAWDTPFSYKTPQGYSLLITHPFNRFDLPFTTMAGIIDADSVVSGGNIPFLLKRGFEGFIPKRNSVISSLTI